ncbi:MAG: phosphohydrolase, partial [Caloramator sp.]|nr:phosphohydrolase [Caloramator sp.]
IKYSSIEAKMLSCADKLSNIRSTVEDYKVMQDKLWLMFNAGYEEQKWYYNEILIALKDLKNYPMYQELKEKINLLF